MVFRRLLEKTIARAKSRITGRATPIPMPALAPVERPVDEFARLGALEAEGVFVITMIILARRLETLPPIRVEVNVDADVDVAKEPAAELEANTAARTLLRKVLLTLLNCARIVQVAFFMIQLVTPSPNH